MSKSEQPIYILVIDKKKMKLEDAGIDDKYLQEYSFFQKKFKKFPIVKAKIGPEIYTLFCKDENVYNEIVCKKECKVLMNGLCIMQVIPKTSTPRQVYTPTAFEQTYRSIENDVTISPDCTIVICSKHIMSQFTNVFLWREQGINLGDMFLVKNNMVYLLDENKNGVVKIDLSKADVSEEKTFRLSEQRYHTFRTERPKISYGLCNMLVNATAQWIGGTPYQGVSVCKDLSQQASDALQKYNMSLELTTTHMTIYKNDRPITFASALKELLNKGL